MRRLQCLLPLLVALLVSGHKEPKTLQEVEVQRALRAAAYDCAPAVAEFTAARKRSYAQKILGERPELLTGQDLFDSGIFDNTIEGGESTDKTFLECSPIRETLIQNNTCVLTPETTEGPYWHKAGHPIRQNIAEFQNGLLLLLDIGLIDVVTCKPLPNVLVDLWHANATGQYPGHIWPEPGQEPIISEKPRQRAGVVSTASPSKQMETSLRGAWPTDRNGVSQFTTIFPGYYGRRATHIHVRAFTEWKILSNGSFTSDALVHTGQFFFDDGINLHVDDMHPYTRNPIRDTLGRARNWHDSSGIFEDSQGPNKEYNPVFNLHLLGSIISQGLVGYITMGVNASAKYDL
ncbi:hypothetical protein GALMADRAFT_130773 [Galerina marginata CBS 339.88]|uniref:Intradiol ring-cleavage dioxygenases domain-containing protein n=1 Tax=Galerina marginata (strain CBS 339.88) TaxID=685588 RepID=A0A067SFR1_GALM3|nr:hypothetical protein GALMADRAFT_259084 [Galerina marginata CBS 339.88]KDR66564.1 hypothetical protein GALMADRAFT_130773 [Galerina marginata CBS 339.88]